MRNVHKTSAGRRSRHESPPKDCISCDECGKSFANLQNLRRHQCAVHDREKRQRKENNSHNESIMPLSIPIAVAVSEPSFN